MMCNKFLVITLSSVVFIIVTVSFQEASALKCWKCSSDEHQSEFCNDPFDLSVATEQQRRWAYVECSLPPGQSNPYDQPLALRAVCKKVKQILNLHTYHVYRLCTWEHVHAPRNECINVHTPSYIKTDFCETCDTDGCNGASNFGPYVLFIIIPIFVAKVLFS